MQKGRKIDMFKLALYILKRCWLPILCGVIGFGIIYWNTEYRKTDTYTASGTMYVYNGNPNVVNYQYTNTSDLNSAVQLLDTYMVVIKSNKVLDAVVDRLIMDYPLISTQYVSASLSMGKISETGVMCVQCTTDEPQKSADICNAVLDVAPAEIIRVVSAGSIEIIDYAVAPLYPDGRSAVKKGLIGGMAGAVAACAVLALIFLIHQQVESSRELTENYTPPILAEIRRDKRAITDPGDALLNKNSPIDSIESYAKLRMNLFYTLIQKDKCVVMLTSAVSGEGKSTIAANLALSCAMSGRKVILIDADMRRACQQDIFHFAKKQETGLSDVLIGNYEWRDVVLHEQHNFLDIMPAGHIPPNPAELLESPAMRKLLAILSEQYDLVLIDTPPLNIVSDPLALAPMVSGALFVVRQYFSDHKELRRALESAETGGLNILGFVFYGENMRVGSYYSRKNYQNYYQKYDVRTK